MAATRRIQEIATEQFDSGAAGICAKGESGLMEENRI